MQLGNIYDTANLDLNREIFDTILDLNNTNLKFERIISNGQSTPEGEWYDQDKTEWVVLLSGKAKLRFEFVEDLIELNPGDYVVINPHERHRVEYTSEFEKTIWLALHY